jgi:hypothetical protein
MGSLLQGFLGLSLAVYTSLYRGLDTQLKKWMTPVPTLILIFIFIVVSVWGVVLSARAAADVSVDGHAIAILTNIIPSLSAMIAIASRFDFTFGNAQK